MANARRLPSGNWRVQVFAGVDNGKRRYKSFTAKTRKEAEYLAARYAATLQDISRSELTIKQAVELYISSKANILSPSTISGYKNILRFYTANISIIDVQYK